MMLAPLRSISTAWVFLFLFYIFFTYFAVLNDPRLQTRIAPGSFMRSEVNVNKRFDACTDELYLRSSPDIC